MGNVGRGNGDGTVLDEKIVLDGERYTVDDKNYITASSSDPVSQPTRTADLVTSAYAPGIWETTSSRSALALQ